MNNCVYCKVYGIECPDLPEYIDEDGELQGRVFDTCIYEFDNKWYLAGGEIPYWN